HAERQTALPGLRNAFHGDAGASRPEDPARRLPDGQQEAAGRRNESSRAADRFLHSQSTAESEESAQSAGVRAFLRNGNHLEVNRRRVSSQSNASPPTFVSWRRERASNPRI